MSNSQPSSSFEKTSVVKATEYYNKSGLAQMAGNIFGKEAMGIVEGWGHISPGVDKIMEGSLQAYYELGILSNTAKKNLPMTDASYIASVNLGKISSNSENDSIYSQAA